MENKSNLKISTFLFMLILFFSGCTNENNDERCFAVANSVFPGMLELNFEENYKDDVDDSELVYVLSEINWPGGVVGVVDRGFHLKKSSRFNRDYYFPFDASSKRDQAWPHTDSIEYSGSTSLEDGSIISFEFSFEPILQGTSTIEYAVEHNAILNKLEENRERGKRKFIVVEPNFIECLISE